jgi:DNA invertase Pin-like site-specific DNA recombinase
MIIGYARVSSFDQDLGLQEAALKTWGCEIVRSEKRSVTSMAGRDELKAILDFLRTGDTLMVTRIDRLARSVADLQDIVRTLRAKGASLKATEQPIDTSTAAGKAFLDMLSVFAEFETALRRERQLEGIAKAKAEGRYKKGRPRKPEIRKRAQELRAQGMRPAAIAKTLGVCRQTVYNILGDTFTRRPLDEAELAARDAS